MTKQEAKIVRQINRDIDKQLRKARRRPMAVSADPVLFSRLGMTADRWVDLTILVLIVVAFSLAVWLSH